MKKNIKSIVLLSLLLSSTVACNQNNGIDYTGMTLDILKMDTSINQFNITEGDSCDLDAINNKNLNLEIEWISSNEEVATVNKYGILDALTYGTTIITARVKDAPYISDSIYVDVKGYVQQTGVGTGRTPQDAIFLGNEGEEEPLEIYFLEMQHIYSDSIYIKKGNVDILIDTGYDIDGQYIDKFLAEHMTDGVLDMFMLSHADGDHINGAPNALKNVSSISLMIDYGGTNIGSVGTLREKYKNKGTAYYTAYDCVNFANNAFDRFYFTEEFYMDVLDTTQYIENTDASGASNPNSVSVIFNYRDFSFFTGGDITESTEQKLIENEELPEVTLFKSPHHGSHGSNSQEFLNTLNPKAVAISAARAGQYNAVPSSTPSKNNTYNLDARSGHPAAEAIQRIYRAPNISQNLNVYWNAVNGTMKFTSYGENDFTFEGSRTMRGYYDLTLTGGTPVWNEQIQDFENKVTGEENYKLHESKVFTFRDYIQYLPEWARTQYYPNY